MLYIESPENYLKKPDHMAIFLAGGITNCPDWQSRIADLLKDFDITLLNPRRKKFPINDPSASKVQISWEFNHLKIADTIIFWFPKESICPVALYELGAWCMTDKPICLGVDSDYLRKIDIEEQTTLTRPDIEIVYSINDLTEQIKICIQNFSTGGNYG